MPKDPTRNIERYKVSGGHLNEFEFHKNQARMTEQFEPATNVSENQPPLTVAEQVALVTAEAHRKVEKRRKLTRGNQSAKASSPSKPASQAARGKQKMATRANSKKAVSSNTARKKATTPKTAARKKSTTGSKKTAGKSSKKAAGKGSKRAVGKSSKKAGK